MATVGQQNRLKRKFFLDTGLFHRYFVYFVDVVDLVDFVYLVGLVYFVYFVCTVYFVYFVYFVGFVGLVRRYLMRPEMIIAVLLASA